MTTAIPAFFLMFDPILSISMFCGAGMLRLVYVRVSRLRNKSLQKVKTLRDKFEAGQQHILNINNDVNAFESSMKAVCRYWMEISSLLNSLRREKIGVKW